MIRRAADGLYVTDAEIGRRLGFGADFAGKLFHELDKRLPGRPAYPQKDPLFGGRRFWPAVLKWHMDYHGLKINDTLTAPAPMWEENFDDDSSPQDAPRTRNSRPHLART